MFIGRENELKEIEEALSSDKFESILIYGRRRVGKTELINEAVKNEKRMVVRYECVKSTIAENLAIFGEKLRSIFGEKYLSFATFRDALAYVFNKAIERKLIFIIDEFSFLLEQDFAIESHLAVLIDEYKGKSDMKFFVSGSYLTLMKKMVEYGSHSYGRFSHIMLLRPFDYFDSAQFYPSYSDEDKIMMYSVFGGVPFISSLIDPRKSALSNILDLFVRRDSIMEHEISEILLNETNKITNMNYLISILARGVGKYGDIASILGQNGDSKPDYILSKLLDMDIVAKSFPINEEGNKKKVFYRFKDNLIDFYYRYIFSTPYQEFRGNPRLFYENFIEEDFKKRYIPHKFENIAKEYLLRKNLRGEINPFLLKIGTYYHDDAKKKLNREFDVVSLDERGYISYECKYTSAPLGRKEIEEEIEQSSNLDIGFYKLGFISKSGFKKDVDKNKYVCISLRDFYK